MSSAATQKKESGSSLFLRHTPTSNFSNFFCGCCGGTKLLSHSSKGDTKESDSVPKKTSDKDKDSLMLRDSAPEKEPEPVDSFLTKYLAEAKRDFFSRWSQSLKSAENIDNFVFRKILGSGSFGQVIAATYKGKRPDLANVPLVAIKVLKKADVLKTHQVEHTLNEKKVSLCLQSEFLMKTYFAFKDAANLYIVMEFMPGGEFYVFLRQKGRFPEPITQFYAAQVVLALQYMHSMQLVYRDLKPENILIGASGYIKLGDFGFAKHVPGKTWTLCGTPQYMAPELLLHKSYGRSVDCWGLGILIFEMCAGYVPFDDSNPMKIYDKIVACNLKFPKSFSRELTDLLLNIIQPDVTKRFGNLKDGMFDVIHHIWFKKVDFIRIHQQFYKPPWKPNTQSILDNFAKAVTTVKLPKGGKDSFSKEFDDF